MVCSKSDKHFFHQVSCLKGYNMQVFVIFEPHVEMNKYVVHDPSFFLGLLDLSVSLLLWKLSDASVCHVNTVLLLLPLINLPG